MQVLKKMFSLQVIAKIILPKTSYQTDRQPHEVISTSQSVGRNVRYISFEFTYKVIDLNIDFEFQSSIFAKSRLNKLGIHI